MSNTDADTELSKSEDCPVINGRRVIKRVPARVAEVGGIPVARAMPSRERRLIGAWCFLDHAGPADFQADSPGLRVGPHPHIGLQTFTWMIEGQILHRDSLGSEQVVRPGQLNLMTAGNGICHTEESLAGETRLHAAQLWIALPWADREIAPRFDHYPKLPRWREQSARLTLLTGRFQGYSAPTLAYSPLVGVDIQMSEAGALQFPLKDFFEYGLLPLEGEFHVGEETFRPNELAYLGCGRRKIGFTASKGARALLLGGEPLDEDILVWWNFVGHSKYEITHAQREWEEGSERFGNVPGYDGERLMPPPIPWVKERKKQSS